MEATQNSKWQGDKEVGKENKTEGLWWTHDFSSRTTISEISQQPLDELPWI